MSADPVPDPVAVLERAEEKDLLPALPGAGKQPPRPPIIVFGDNNWSFSTTLLEEDGHNGHLHATIYEDLMDEKHQAKKNKYWQKLQDCGASVHHSVDATKPDSWPIQHPAVIHFNLPWPTNQQPNFQKNDALQKFVLQVFLVAESQQQPGDKFYMIVQQSKHGIDFYQKWYNLGEVVTKTGYRITNFAKPPAYDFEDGQGDTVSLYQIEFTLRPPSDSVKEGRGSSLPRTWYSPQPSSSSSNSSSSNISVLIWDVPAAAKWAPSEASREADAETD